MFQRPITTICWGHRDSRLFLACGPALYVVRVEHRVASLQLLCQQGIASALREEKDVGKLNMPSLLCSYVTTAFIPTIKVHRSLINCCAVTVARLLLTDFVSL